MLDNYQFCKSISTVNPPYFSELQVTFKLELERLSMVLGNPASPDSRKEIRKDLLLVCSEMGFGVSYREFHSDLHIRSV